MAIRPLDNRIVVKAVEAAEKTSGGILLPDSAKEKPQRGIVVAVGPGARAGGEDRVPVDLNVGDEIIYGKYAGNEIQWNGEDYKILTENDVLAVIA